MLGAAKKKDVYVPAPRGKLAAVPKPSRIPLDMTRAVARAFFRAIPWDGERPPEVAPPPPTEFDHLDPRTPARVAFAKVAWTGERPEAATSAQSKNATRNVLNAFRWE